MKSVLPLFDAALIVGAVVNLVLLVVDRTEAKAVGDVVTTVLALAVLVRWCW